MYIHVLYSAATTLSTQRALSHLAGTGSWRAVGKGLRGAYIGNGCQKVLAGSDSAKYSSLVTPPGFKSDTAVLFVFFFFVWR